MDKMPLQTLKNIQKLTSEELINNLTIECASVRRNFKPTVRTRREYEPDDEVDFDTEFEKEWIKVESEVDNIYLKETLPKVEQELNRWVHQYKNLLNELHQLHDDNLKDQKTLKESNVQIDAKLERVSIVETIKNSLLHEVRKLCLELEKTKHVSDERFRRATDNFNEVTRYLQSQIESERNLADETNKILRKLENTLRDTVYHYQSTQQMADVLQEDLKKTKFELHRCQRKMAENDLTSKKTAMHIRKLEDELEDAKDRAEFAEESLNRYRHNMQHKH